MVTVTISTGVKSAMTEMYSMTREEENYKIKERSELAVKEHGSVEKALKFIKSELKDFEDSWGRCSSDCLSHGITCNRLLVGLNVKW